jgi:DnaK suppressor protein
MCSAHSWQQHGTAKLPFPEQHMQSAAARDRLQQRRRELLERSERIHSDLRGETIQVEGGFSEQAVAHANDTVLEAIQTSAEGELAQIDIALRRIDEGCYERCALCGGQIAQARLQAVPYATTCVACAGTIAP